MKSFIDLRSVKSFIKINLGYLLVYGTAAILFLLALFQPISPRVFSLSLIIAMIFSLNILTMARYPLNELRASICFGCLCFAIMLFILSQKILNIYLLYLIGSFAVIILNITIPRIAAKFKMTIESCFVDHKKIRFNRFTGLTIFLAILLLFIE